MGAGGCRFKSYHPDHKTKASQAAQFRVEKKTDVKTLNRYIGDDLVTHAMYDGHQVGHGGSYMAGLVKGELIKDKNGKPLPLNHIGVLK